MWTCPACGVEVDDDFELCWSCGTSVDGVKDPGFCPEVDGVITPEDYAATARERAHETLVTVATFTMPAEAYVAQNRLLAEGINAYLADEQTISMDWLLANAIGGIKLQVAEHDAPRALEVLAARHSAAPAEEPEEPDERISETPPRRPFRPKAED
jgi:hypothetical protein